LPESDLQQPLVQKTREWLEGDATGDQSLAVTPHLRIRPSQAESPLRDEEFDAGEFAELMSGLSTAAGPKGGATAIIPKEEIIETMLDMDPEAVLPNQGADDDLALPDETSEEVREAFEEFTDADPPALHAETESTETLANRYQDGDIVETPDSGVGVIAGAVAEDQPAPDDSDLPDIEASPDSPTYVVVTEEDTDRGMGLYKASDLDATEIDTEVDALDTTQEMAQAAALAALAPDDSRVAELDFTMPESWRESDTPARIIALKAFAGMGGSFDGCVREMRGTVSSPDAFCGAFLDEVLGYEAWRGDSPLPGD